MEKDFSELVEYLDNKFNKIDDKFDKIDDKFDKIDDKFNKIDDKFNNLQNIFITKEDMKELIQNLATKEEFRDLQTSVDAYAKKADGYFQEMVMLSHKSDRHEK